MPATFRSSEISEATPLMYNQHGSILGLIVKSHPLRVVLWAHLATSPEQFFQKRVLKRSRLREDAQLTEEIVDNIFEFIGPTTDVFFLRFRRPVCTVSFADRVPIGINTLVIPSISKEHATHIFSVLMFTGGIFNLDALETFYGNLVSVAVSMNPFHMVDKCLAGTALILETKVADGRGGLELDFDENPP